VLFRHYGADSIRVARARVVATGGQEYPELPGAGEGGRSLVKRKEGILLKDMDGQKVACSVVLLTRFSSSEAIGGPTDQP